MSKSKSLSAAWLLLHTPAPSCEPQFQALFQDTVHSPPALPVAADTQPTSPPTPPGAHAASVTKTSLEAQALLSEPSPRVFPAKLPGSRTGGWAAGGPGLTETRTATSSEPGRAPRRREPPSLRTERKARDATTLATRSPRRGHTARTPKRPRAQGFLTRGPLPRKLQGKGQRVRRKDRLRGRFREGSGMVRPPPTGSCCSGDPAAGGGRGKEAPPRRHRAPGRSPPFPGSKSPSPGLTLN